MTLKKAERRGDNFVPVRNWAMSTFAPRALAFTAGILMTIAPTSRAGSSADHEKAVAALDTEYQAAVKANDVATMDRILADDFVLVTGLGKTYTKADLLNEARSKRTIYEHQEDSTQKVRVWGDTAVVTALLWAKGTEDGKAFDYKLWFSDTYVRAPAGWRYVFGQASTRLPKTP
jgi:ketosteroid isomerase-like protein